MIDLEPAARRLAALLQDTADDQLPLPTPCPGLCVGDLVDHLSMFAVSFTTSARKETEGRDGAPPAPTVGRLEPGWRDRVERELVILAEAWQDPSAWEGVTLAGTIEMPAELVGLVAVDELVVHGWDIARSTGRDLVATVEEVEGALTFVTSFEVPRDGSLFGPEVPVAETASPMERLLGLAGRDPGWHPLGTSLEGS